MEEFPTNPKSLENQKPEKRKENKEFDPERRKFLKASAGAAGSIAIGKGAMDYLKKMAEKEIEKKNSEKTESSEIQKGNGEKNTSEENVENERTIENQKMIEKEENLETFSKKEDEEEKFEVQEKKFDENDKEDQGQEIKKNEKISGKEDELDQWAEKTGKKNIVHEIKRRYGGRIRIASEQTGIKPEVLTAVIAYESHGKEDAVSPMQAYGLMQLKKATAKSVGVTNVNHPYDNIVGGARYLKKMMQKYNDINAALAAYNMGPTRLNKKMKKGYDPKKNDYAKRVMYLAGLMD